MVNTKRYRFKYLRRKETYRMFWNITNFVASHKLDFLRTVRYITCVIWKEYKVYWRS